MVDIQYSLADVAKITGKSEKTISRWIKSGKLPAVRHGTGYLITENDIPLRLDPSLNRHEFIQKRLLVSASSEPVLSSHSSGSRGVDISGLIDVEKVAGLITGGQVDNSGKNLENLSLMLQKHQTELEKIIREQNELAEKYARATYKIGQLEERNRQLEETNLRHEQKLQLLPLPDQWTSTQKEMGNLKDDLMQKEISYQTKVNRLEQDLERAEETKKELQIALETEKNKGFWQRLFGRS
ncbi:MAG: helix-turn-helix domain-containing protein [Candidatus Sericytochromatia bacterium]|nr:helix-turn-helix domain-containing protein [Candidatus Sericytochromatia bacterium]